jgi:2-polyprenyl-3-methyl-5-hydroxy-6-metoxy-1,4-benzoquinol methylase
MVDYLFPDLRHRNTLDRELMDHPDADLPKLLRTIRQFDLLNRLFSGSRGLFRAHVFSVMERDPERVYTLLDVGAGGCDIAIWAAREARRRRLKLRIKALDCDERILPLAVHAVRDYPEIRPVTGNALDLGPWEPFDFVFSNHFLHHLAWEEIALFLHQALAKTRLAFVMNDLRRSHLAYLGCTIFTGLLTHGSFAFDDGRLSIRRAFKPEELRDFLQQNFPAMPIDVLTLFPERVVLVHRAPSRAAPSALLQRHLKP